MSDTPAAVPVKPKLSSSLKERLKRCGRYHASPEPVAKQPKISLASTVQEKTQNDSTVKGIPVSPCTKRQCIDTSPDKESTCSSRLKSPIVTGTKPNKSVSLNLGKSVDNKSASKNKTDHCALNLTPLSQRSRSCLSNVKGSKLNFEETTKENVNEEQIIEEIPSVSSDNRTSEQSDRCNLVEPKTDPSESMSRSKLLNEIKVKEEQLRNLRMVRMYRSKNNLEELQTLIDKWRDISQQALQDLHAAMPEPRPSLTELINHLGVDHQLVHFSAEDDETFF